VAKGCILGQSESSAQRTSSVAVDRGLYLVRYVSAQEAANAPIAEVRQAIGSEGAIEIISAPGIPIGKLTRPGSCLVVRAEQAGELTVLLRAKSPGSSLEASFRLESLISREEAESQNGAIAAGARSAVVGRPALSTSSGMASPRSVTPSPAIVRPGAMVPAMRDRSMSVRGDISFLAHVAMRGDVLVSGDEWAGGPESPGPIEGLEIKPGAQSGVKVELQVLVGSRPPRWSEWVAAGSYAGTKGRGLPLAGVRLRLHGSAPESTELLVDGLFVGSTVITKRGREVELVSGAGTDPLVGLRLGLRSMEKVVTPSLSVVSGVEPAPRVRVFRASTA
jgi:hypothetical protein